MQHTFVCPATLTRPDPTRPDPTRPDPARPDPARSDPTRPATFVDIRRENAPELKKAGNLRYAFARTSGEAIAILDADFCPRADFLKETVPYFGHDASIGILQTPQFFRFKKEQTWVEQGAGVTQEFFYRMVQVKIYCRYFCVLFCVV